MNADYDAGGYGTEMEPPAAERGQRRRISSLRTFWGRIFGAVVMFMVLGMCVALVVDAFRLRGGLEWLAVGLASVMLFGVLIGLLPWHVWADDTGIVARRFWRVWRVPYGAIVRVWRWPALFPGAWPMIYLRFQTFNGKVRTICFTGRLARNQPVFGEHVDIEYLRQKAQEARAPRPTPVEPMTPADQA